MFRYWYDAFFGGILDGGGGGEDGWRDGAVEVERGRCVRKEYIYMCLVCSLGYLLTHRDGSRAQIPHHYP